MFGPILWWIDKAHTEAFTFSLLTIGFALMSEAPWWTMVAFAAAATQNMPMAGALAFAVASSLVRRPGYLRDWRWWVGVVIGASIPALAMLSTLRRHGTVSPLLRSSLYRIPSPAEIGVLLWDPNLGLFVNFVALAPVVIALAMIMTARNRRALVTPEIVAGASIFVGFLFAAAQAVNVNHGGTPGMSRYVVWLIPTAIPLLMCAHATLPRRVNRWLGPVVVVSAVWSLACYQPRFPEGSSAPTQLARYLWTHAPSVNNPLAEVFVERLTAEGQNWLPVATPGCEKVLLFGRSGRDPLWPFPCPPVTPPSACQENGRLCYANKTASGYRFVEVPRRRDEVFKLRREATWTRGGERVASHLFTRMGWPELDEAPALVDAREQIGRVAIFARPGRLIACLRDIRPRAALTIRLPEAMDGVLVDAETGEARQEVHAPEGGVRLEIGASRSDLILALSSIRSGR